jgi:thiol:disulfide interchange protein
VGTVGTGTGLDGLPATDPLAPGGVPGTGQVNFRSDLASARAEATQSGRPIFVDIFSTTCAPCQQLATQTFPDPRVTAALARFVAVKLDVADPANAQLHQQLGGRGVPFLAVLGPDGGKRAAREGFVDAAGLVAWLQQSGG